MSNTIDIEERYAATIQRIVDEVMEKHYHPQVIAFRREQQVEVRAVHAEILDGLDPDKTYTHAEVVELVTDAVKFTSAVFGVALLFDDINN